MDDTSYGYVNGNTIISQGSGQDSGFIDVTSYIVNGVNKFNFLTYNGDTGYCWGFQIKKNNVIVFTDVAGQQGVYGANNNDFSKTNQYVYNQTISINVTKC